MQSSTKLSTMSSLYLQRLKNMNRPSYIKTYSVNIIFLFFFGYAYLLKQIDKDVLGYSHNLLSSSCMHCWCCINRDR